MAANVQLLMVWIRDVVLRVLSCFAQLLISSLFSSNLGGWGASSRLVGLEDDSVHAINGPTVLVLAWEELLTAHGTRHDVTHQGISLGQVSREIHLLPGQTIKTEVNLNLK